jgi:hypothetical protein
MAPYVRSGDTQKVFLDVPWNRSSMDSLRGRFLLQRVSGEITADPQLSDSLSYIDSMKVHFDFFSALSLLKILHQPYSPMSATIPYQAFS